MLVKWSEAKNTKHNGRASELDESEAKDWYVLLKTKQSRLLKHQTR